MPRRRWFPAPLDPTADDKDGYVADLKPLLHRLARDAGAATLSDCVDPDRPAPDNGDLLAYLPRDYRPDLPAPQRLAQEAVAIGVFAAHRPWRLYLCRAARPADPDPDRELARLCDLAELLCLDLVVDHRARHAVGALSWHVRVEAPGMPPPADYGFHAGLDEALARTPPVRALKVPASEHLHDRNAPARWITRTPVAPSPPALTAEEVATRLTILRGAGPGALATWRDGRWHFTTLVDAGTREILFRWDTGQISVRREAVLVRQESPPPPRYWAEPVPQRPCPTCASGTAWNRCPCRRGEPGTPREDCELCHGNGHTTGNYCYTCGNVGHIHTGAVITVTDLDRRVLHINWRPDDAAAAEPVTMWGDIRMIRLGEQHRIAHWVDAFGGIAEQAVDLLTDNKLDMKLAEGLITPADEPHPLRALLEQVSHGRPGARMLIQVRDPNEPPTPTLPLLHLIIGLRLAVHIAVVNHGHNPDNVPALRGVKWNVEAVAQAAAIKIPVLPSATSLSEATSRRLPLLHTTVTAAVPPASTTPLPVPRQPVSEQVDTGDVEALMRRLADHHPRRIVMARLDRGGCRIYLETTDGADLVATSATLPEAVTSLLGPATATP